MQTHVGVNTLLSWQHQTFYISNQLHVSVSVYTVKLKLQTFPLKALFSEDADESKELCDLFQIKHSSVVELDDSQRLLVIGTATAILHEPAKRKKHL